MNQDDLYLKEQLRAATYAPAKELVRILEERAEDLDIEQLMQLEKLRYGLKMYELEQAAKEQRKGGFRWA
jgi:hypothetical protein